MKIVLIGASGRVGTLILEEALSRNYDVVALVRNPENIIINDKRLKVIKVDVLHDDFSSLLSDVDAVISAYNPGWQNPNIYNDFIKGSAAILATSKIAGVKRLLVVGGAGSLEINGSQLVDSKDFPEEWKQGALGARDFLNILKKDKEIKWTFLSPAIMLGPGERTGKYRIGTDSPVFDSKGECKISFADLAVALLDELEKGQFIQKRFTIGY